MTNALPPGLTLQEATPDEMRQVLTWTLPLWGGGQSLEAYEAQMRSQLATPWGRAHYRFVVGRDERGALVTACKRYRFAMRRAGAPARAVGFGAVFTAPKARGRGHAFALLSAIMAEEAAQGVQLALLYSDIGAAYYEKLGFAAVGAQRAEAPAAPGPLSFRPPAAGELSALASWQANGADPALAYERPAPYWEYLQVRRAPEVLVYAPDGAARGFAAVKIDRAQLWILEAGHGADVEPAAFWGALRRLAHARGCTQAAGWLPSAAAAGGFVHGPIGDGLPMVRALDGQALPERIALWELDHF